MVGPAKSPQGREMMVPVSEVGMAPGPVKFVCSLFTCGGWKGVAVGVASGGTVTRINWKGIMVSEKGADAPGLFSVVETQASGVRVKHISKNPMRRIFPNSTSMAGVGLGSFLEGHIVLFREKHNHEPPDGGRVTGVSGVALGMGSVTVGLGGTEVGTVGLATGGGIVELDTGVGGMLGVPPV